MRRELQLASLLALSLPGPVSALELDTAETFTDDALEISLPFQAAVGWPRYQEGRIGDWEYRIDPDGYTLLDRDARTSADDWEIRCDEALGCAARRAGLNVTLNDANAPMITFDDLLASTRLSLSADGPSDLEAAAFAQMSPELWHQIVEARVIQRTDTAGAEPFRLDGIRPAFALLRWIENDQAPDLRYAAACAPVDNTSPASDATIGGGSCWPLAIESSSPQYDGSEPPFATPSKTAEAMPTDIEFLSSVDTLRGVDAVHVFVDHLAEPDYLTGSLRTSVKEMAETRLRDAGLQILDEEQVKTWPGKPELRLYFTEGARDKGCVFRIWMSFRQEVMLARDPSGHIVAGTWGSGGPALEDVNEAPEVGTFTYHIDRFINDHAAANAPQQPETQAEEFFANTQPPIVVAQLPEAEVIKPLQMALAGAGYPVGPVDGIKGLVPVTPLRRLSGHLGCRRQGPRPWRCCCAFLIARSESRHERPRAAVDSAALKRLQADLGGDIFAVIWANFQRDIAGYEQRLAELVPDAPIPSVETIAHGVLGCAKTCHAPALAEAAQKLEAACRSQDVDAVDVQRRALLAGLAEIRAASHEHFGTTGHG